MGIWINFLFSVRRCARVGRNVPGSKSRGILAYSVQTLGEKKQCAACCGPVFSPINATPGAPSPIAQRHTTTSTLREAHLLGRSISPPAPNHPCGLPTNINALNPSSAGKKERNKEKKNKSTAQNASASGRRIYTGTQAGAIAHDAHINQACHALDVSLHCAPKEGEKEKETKNKKEDLYRHIHTYTCNGRTTQTHHCGEPSVSRASPRALGFVVRVRRAWLRALLRPPAPPPSLFLSPFGVF